MSIQGNGPYEQITILSTKTSECLEGTGAIPEHLGDWLEIVYVENGNLVEKSTDGCDQDFTKGNIFGEVLFSGKNSIKRSNGEILKMVDTDHVDIISTRYSNQMLRFRNERDVMEWKNKNIEGYLNECNKLLNSTEQSICAMQQAFYHADNDYCVTAHDPKVRTFCEKGVTTVSNDRAIEALPKEKAGITGYKFFMERVKINSDQCIGDCQRVHRLAATTHFDASFCDSIEESSGKHLCIQELANKVSIYQQGTMVIKYESYTISTESIEDLIPKIKELSMQELCTQAPSPIKGYMCYSQTPTNTQINLQLIENNKE
ncbi:MAG: hypothetical protein ACI83D_000332 [Planctomycetota bacterium]